ncbi:hypothetical protein HDU89_006527 [Geranomyces variabilis]|nr:hypothetical protein HDU89_006527 [Geranomyces variabilis]
MNTAEEDEIAADLVLGSVPQPGRSASDNLDGCIAAVAETNKRTIYLVAVTAVFVTFGISTSASAFDQAVIQGYCQAHYDAVSGSNDKGSPALDCSLPDILGPASAFGSLLYTILTVPSLVTSLFTGPLSDSYGRKPVLGAWFFGMLFDTLCPILVVRFGVGMWILAFGKLLLGICGGISTPTMLLYSQLADVCAPQDRSKYLGVLSGLAMLGSLSGMLVGGWLVKSTGSFEPTFIVSFFLMMAAFAYFVLVVPETNRPRPALRSAPKEPLRVHAARSLRNTLASLRKLPLVVLGVSLLDLGMRAGLVFLVPFYTAQVFNWKTWENTLFSAENAACMAITTMVVLPIVDRAVRRWVMRRQSREQEGELTGEREPLIPSAGRRDDAEARDAEGKTLINASIGLFELRLFILLTAIHCALFALAQRDWMLFAIIPFQALGHLSAIAARTLLLEFAAADTYGTVNSSYGVLLSLTDMLVIKATSALFDLGSRTSAPSMVFWGLEALSLSAFAGTFLVTFRTSEAARNRGPAAA